MAFRAEDGASQDGQEDDGTEVLEEGGAHVVGVESGGDINVGNEGVEQETAGEGAAGDGQKVQNRDPSP